MTLPPMAIGAAEREVGVAGPAAGPRRVRREHNLLRTGARASAFRDGASHVDCSESRAKIDAVNGRDPRDVIISAASFAHAGEQADGEVQIHKMHG